MACMAPSTRGRTRVSARRAVFGAENGRRLGRSGGRQGRHCKQAYYGRTSKLHRVPHGFEDMHFPSNALHSKAEVPTSDVVPPVLAASEPAAFCVGHHTGTLKAW